MKEKKLLRALGNVDNQYIKEAEPMKKTSKITNRQKWVSVAACFVLVVVIGAVSYTHLTLPTTERV